MWLEVMERVKIEKLKVVHKKLEDRKNKYEKKIDRLKNQGEENMNGVLKQMKQVSCSPYLRPYDLNSPIPEVLKINIQASDGYQFIQQCMGLVLPDIRRIDLNNMFGQDEKLRTFLNTSLPDSLETLKLNDVAHMRIKFEFYKDALKIIRNLKVSLSICNTQFNKENILILSGLVN